MVTGLFAGIALVAGGPLQAGGITSLAMLGDRLEVSFDGPVTSASALTIDGPRRIALDLEGATVGGAQSYSGRNSPFVAQVRQGQFTSRAVRLVLDLDRPAVISSMQFSQDGRKLTVMLGAADSAGFVAARDAGPAIVTASGADMDVALLPKFDFTRPPRKSHSITVSIPPAARGVKLPRIYGPNDGKRPLVVIDAGHGGHDPGAINSEAEQQEKNVTLAIARAIRDELVAAGNVRVALTREDDRFLALRERYEIARKLQADLFISIHADAAENGEARGATVYTLSETASDREAARLAARENKADVINGIDLGDQNGDVTSILIDLTQRETMNLSSNFAQLLHREASDLISFRKGYHRFASLMVLKAPDMPSVLFETGYISNPDDVKVLASRAGQRKIARGVARAIGVHFARRLAMR